MDMPQEQAEWTGQSVRMSIVTRRGWMPIETAPRDGSWVLVYGEGTDDEDEQRKIAVAQYTRYLNGRHKEEGWWQFARYDGGYYGRFMNPTHWMPLPETPSVNVQCFLSRALADYALHQMTPQELGSDPEDRPC